MSWTMRLEVRPMKPKRKEAVSSANASILCRVKSKRAVGDGLMREHKARSSSAASAKSANMPASRRMTGRELGGLREISRRMTAAPALIGDVAFSLSGVRTHGRIAPALYRSCGLMPCGKPSGLPLPRERSANPHGVALLLVERGGFRQFDSRSQP